MGSDEQPAALSGEPFGTMVVRGAWAARRAGVGAVDARRIRSYRFHHERLALAVALLALVGSTAAAYVLVSQQVAALIVGTMVAQAIAVRFQVKALVGRAAEVTPAQFAGLHAVVRRGIEALDIPSTRVFVVQDPNPNAFSFGFSRPYGVVLTSSLVEALDETELAAVIGHEMGHIRFGHTRVSLLFGGVDVPLGIPFVQYVIRAPFLWWMRCAELSADRAGLAVCGRVSKVISGLVKVAVGPQLYGQVRPDELARQADEFYRGPWAVVSQLQSPHPFLVSRVQQIVDFAGPPEPGHDLNLVRPDGLNVRPAGAPGSKAHTPGPAPSAEPRQAAPVRAPLAPPDPAWPASDGGAPAWSAASEPEPAAPAPAWLAIDPPGGEARFRVPAGWMTAGRGDDNDLVMADPRVSYRHFGIQWESGGYVVYDLNSRNGTRVNGQTVRQSSLHHGDEIEVGGTRLLFSSFADRQARGSVSPDE